MITDTQVRDAAALRQRVAEEVAKSDPAVHPMFESDAVNAITCALLQVEAMHDLADCVNPDAGLAKTVLP